MINERVQRDSYCAWRIHCHTVSLTKRVGIIIAEAVEGIVRRYTIEMGAIGSDNYYIRRLCSMLPKVELRRSIQVFEIIASREIFPGKPTMKRELRGGEF